MAVLPRVMGVLGGWIRGLIVLLFNIGDQLLYPTLPVGSRARNWLVSLSVRYWGLVTTG